MCSHQGKTIGPIAHWDYRIAGIKYQLIPAPIYSPNRSTDSAAYWLNATDRSGHCRRIDVSPCRSGASTKTKLQFRILPVTRPNQVVAPIRTRKGDASRYLFRHCSLKQNAQKYDPPCGRVVELFTTYRHLASSVAQAIRPFRFIPKRRLRSLFVAKRLCKQMSVGNLKSKASQFRRTSCQAL